VISEQGGETLVYENLTGDYKQSPVIMDKVYYSLVNNDKVETYKGFGIYYDNPKSVETSKLRSEIGCILEEKDSVKVVDLKKNNYNIKIFPKGSYLVTEFPFKGKFSVIIGLMKVYPALTDYLKKHGYGEKGAVMEIYDTPNRKIVYRKEIVKG
jgi:effector-binding domain-containing protein